MENCGSSIGDPLPRAESKPQKVTAGRACWIIPTHKVSVSTIAGLKHPFTHPDAGKGRSIQPLLMRFRSERLWGLISTPEVSGPITVGLLLGYRPVFPDRLLFHPRAPESTSLPKTWLCRRALTASDKRGRPSGSWPCDPALEGTLKLCEPCLLFWLR